MVGVSAFGAEVASPQEGAILVDSTGVTQKATISGNRLVLEPDPVGIETVADGATIVGNRIEGSFAGIKTRGADPNRGNLIQGNVIENADVFGIRLFNDSNVVIGNTIFNPGHSGVVSEGGNHNRIGGDLAAEENEITGSGGEGAIIIAGLEAQRNEVAANHGSGNEQAFLSLFPQSSSEKLNGGIEPPVFGTVLQSSAAGTAKPGATVRIFRKATAEAGELASLLAVVVADGSGNWKATFTQVPVGTRVAATATSDAGTPEGGTSEVSAPKTVAADPVVPVVPVDNGGGAAPPAAVPPIAPPTTPPAVAPKTKLGKGPTKFAAGTPAKFAFSSSVAGSRFQCKLDKGKFKKCRSPQKYKGLKVGNHSFQVRAVGPTGLVDKTPAKRSFTVVE